jgi:FAD:protein FMN transferase
MAPSPHSTPQPDGISLEARRNFRCFNTDVSLEMADWRWAHLLPATEAFFHDFESQFSRFLPDSELSRFNRRATDAVAVSKGMFELLTECLRLYHQTGGVFNPLVLENLEAAGYNASFEKLPSGAAAKAGAPSIPPALTYLTLDAQRQEASLPAGLRLDFGGIGKGYAVDVASAMLAEAGDYLVDAGGDIYAAGHAPDGGPWRIDVADPATPDARIDVVTISNQAIATSWTTRRRWQTASGWAHHLIDPRSGLPTESGAIGSTVIASRAVEADVFAKCALILGPDAGLAFLEKQGTQGVLVLTDGSLRKTQHWPSA